jgi:F0F1-type ATP synthase assembly protein I
VTDSGPPARQPPKRAAWFRYTDTASVGIEMVLAVAIGAFAGMWLERNVTHWSPWTTLIGVGIGLGAAIKAVVRTARTYKRELAADREAAQIEGRADHDDREAKDDE